MRLLRNAHAVCMRTSSTVASFPGLRSSSKFVHSEGLGSGMCAAGRAFYVIQLGHVVSYVHRPGSIVRALTHRPIPRYLRNSKCFERFGNIICVGKC